MKRKFFLFHIDEYRPMGGTLDLIGSFDTLELAQDAIPSHHYYEIATINDDGDLIQIKFGNCQIAHNKPI